jgi:hypothetical protein
LFRRLSTPLVVACEDLFAWQCIHEGNFWMWHFWPS